MTTTFRFALRHKTCRHFDEPNWEVLARNKTDARRVAGRLWREENGRYDGKFGDYKLVWKTEENPQGLV